MIWRLLLALVQLAIVAGLATQAQWTLLHGTRVRLDTEPVDPRSLFQGDYVRLGYPIARSPLPFRPVAGETVWLTLAAQGETWSVTAVTRERPPPPAVAIRAMVPAEPAGRLVLGLETIFVPEGEGRAIEDRAAGLRIQLDAVVAPDGNARPAALLIDGRTAYRSGLF
jgi:uncharacterized membrane-anchored protein